MKVFNIDRNTEQGLKNYLALFQSSHPLFKAVEKEFNDWLDNSNPASEYSEMYFSEDAIYDKAGAIRGGIEQIFEVMDEENLPFIYLNDKRLDLTCAFAD